MKIASATFVLLTAAASDYGVIGPTAVLADSTLRRASAEGPSGNNIGQDNDDMLDARRGLAESLLVREDNEGVPVMNKEDRANMGLDVDTAPTEELWRDYHRGFFRCYTGARNDLETPVAMRTQFIYWKLQLAVLAATKIHDKSGLEMLEPFPTKDSLSGQYTYAVPSYKLPSDQLEELYEDDISIKEFRAKAAACALYQWWKVGLTQYMQGDDRLFDMEDYLLELGLAPALRQNDCFDAWKSTNDWSSWDTVVDVTAECVPERRGSSNSNSKILSLSPQCVAEGIVESLIAWQCDDGWNQCGMDRNTGQLLPKAFSDVIGYQATHQSNSGLGRSLGPGRNWAPLIECERGFCAAQEHVVPHVGFTGATYFLSQADRTNIVSGVVKPLIVNYREEMNKILTTMEDNVNDDPLYKTKIAYHDNKFQFAAGTRQIRARNANTWEEQIFMQNAFLGVEYEGIMINWQAKVLNDHVRPTTVAQELLGEREIAGWQYGEDTSKTYPAREWTPYIRQMPHGEFPSGSACLCSGGASIYAELFNRDYDDESLYVEVDYNDYPNSVEPPLQDTNFDIERYNSLKAYADECTQSRFYGGMHFEFSLEPGSRMCTTDAQFTKKAAAFNKYIWTGNEDFLTEFGGIGNFGYRGDREFEWY